ncbi:hypothetical protein [Microcystis sp. LE19-195.1E]|uniref:hypothetical protein n=1 Tax=Microcystis sp. LE19-195.1E TaxID=3016440 RepID=UPI00258452CF|nr:hypothetical protein [Microcystis sp. LE19-195.1E]
MLNSGVSILRVRRQETGDRRQETGDRRQLFSPHFPTPYTPHPTPHFPTPHTPHPTPHTLHPTPYTPLPHFSNNCKEMLQLCCYDSLPS